MKISLILDCMCSSLHNPNWRFLCLTLPVPKRPKDRLQHMIDVGLCCNRAPIVLIPKNDRGLFSAENPTPKS